jgi:hypothetical protein
MDDQKDKELNSLFSFLLGTATTVFAGAIGAYVLWFGLNGRLSQDPKKSGQNSVSILAGRWEAFSVSSRSLASCLLFLSSAPN